MRLPSLAFVALLLLAPGCAILRVWESPGPAAELPRIEPVQDISDVEQLVQYSAFLRHLDGQALAREHTLMRQKAKRAKTSLNRAKLALIYALPGLASRDDAKAVVLLKPLAKETTSPGVRNFALLVLSLVTENQRLDNNMRSLSAKLKEEQRRSLELQQKLDALKLIEKSLSDRDRGTTLLPKK